MENKKIKLELKERIAKLEREIEKEYESTKRIIETYGSELAGDVWDKYYKMQKECELLKSSFEVKNKKIKLETLVMKDGRVSEMSINVHGANYLTKFNSEKIVISGASPYPGGEYNKKTSEITWELRHSCNFSIFSRPTSILENPCVACENKGKTTDKEIGHIYGNSDLIDIVEYSKKIENEANDFAQKYFKS